MYYYEQMEKIAEGKKVGMIKRVWGYLKGGAPKTSGGLKINASKLKVKPESLSTGGPEKISLLKKHGPALGIGAGVTGVGAYGLSRSSRPAQTPRSNQYNQFYRR